MTDKKVPSKNDKNFGYLGHKFQIVLLHLLVTDKKFAQSLLPTLDASYFDNTYFRLIAQIIKEFHTKYDGVVPSFDVLEQLSHSEVPTEMARKNVQDVLKEMRQQEVEEIAYYKEKAKKFCKQQELYKAIKLVETIITKGDFENYDQAEELIQKALQVGEEEEEDNTDAFDNLAEVLTPDFRHPIPMGIKGVDDVLGGGLGKGELGVILAPTGVGKAQPLTAKILTPTGWCAMGDIKVGDRLIGSDGDVQYVDGVYPQEGLRPIYRVEFTDGTATECDGEHLWSVNTLNLRTAKTRVKGKSVYRPKKDAYEVKTTLEIMKNIKKRGRYNYRVPNLQPVHFAEQKLLVDPYLLGVLIGDGCLTDNCLNVSTKDDEIFQQLSGITHCWISEYPSSKGTKTISFKRGKNDLRDDLKELGLYNVYSDSKFIPKMYLYTSLKDRIALLQGIMDTDGCVSGSGFEYTTGSKVLSEDVKELILSLGGSIHSVQTRHPKYMYLNEVKTGALSYRIYFSLPSDCGFNPFRLTRKKERSSFRTHYKNNKFIKSITYLRDDRAQCIKVSNADSLYVTDNYILTHNTTIMTKIASEAYKLGYNVLHIFFEDQKKQIQRKHLCAITGISPNFQHERVEEITSIISEFKEKSKGKLILRKYASESMTFNELKAKILKIVADGNKLDMIVIDYVDCIIAGGEEYSQEGTLMRRIEGLGAELDVVVWTATQGNRSSISSDVVTTDQMGGSIKKAQVGHVIISIAKNLAQREQGLATIAITKSRISRDGVVFENCRFNNELLDIDVEESNTLLGYENNKEEQQRKNNQARINRALGNIWQTNQNR